MRDSIQNIQLEPERKHRSLRIRMCESKLMRILSSSNSKGSSFSNAVDNQIMNVVIPARRSCLKPKSQYAVPPLGDESMASFTRDFLNPDVPEGVFDVPSTITALYTPRSSREENLPVSRAKRKTVLRSQNNRYKEEQHVFADKLPVKASDRCGNSSFGRRSETDSLDDRISDLASEESPSIVCHLRRSTVPSRLHMTSQIDAHPVKSVAPVGTRKIARERPIFDLVPARRPSQVEKGPVACQTATTDIVVNENASETHRASRASVRYISQKSEGHATAEASKRVTPGARPRPRSVSLTHDTRVVDQRDLQERPMLLKVEMDRNADLVIQLKSLELAEELVDCPDSADVKRLKPRALPRPKSMFDPSLRRKVHVQDSSCLSELTKRRWG
ncbi:hypothetical protein SARC_04567 [Sphaeroforma arctica JP610]|uniref:Uncharacterized protein n=1 Tax=Sphaeroforma arctica JP610 TaxID=667725 RepID=A0A0L0G2X1_9EUKA|nr:hypothetical protein SARC_04567 [Sphaeroforma arctica JP610]KNC83161.1 hypothetical protein SARC_04567 [Sphaeroforma arctica JP610]|eukprot:XP_014157063.1 hypothetical protein SARC_04567 [Sphaeroforma arctica JP610]